jgi:acetyl esterase/lipase
LALSLIKDVPPHLRLTSSLTRTHPPYGFISLDYRLAPQTRLPSILADTLSAISFITSPSSAFAKAIEGRLDTSRLVVSGSSAGGWLALMVGTGAGFKECGLQEPFGRESGRGKLLKGVVGIYPITGLEDPFWTEKKRRKYTPISVPRPPYSESVDRRGS